MCQARIPARSLRTAVLDRSPSDDAAKAHKIDSSNGGKIGMEDASHQEKKREIPRLYSIRVEGAQAAAIAAVTLLD